MAVFTLWVIHTRSLSFFHTDLRSLAPPSSPHIWQHCITLILALIGQQRWPLLSVGHCDLWLFAHLFLLHHSQHLTPLHPSATKDTVRDEIAKAGGHTMVWWHESWVWRCQIYFIGLVFSLEPQRSVSDRAASVQDVFAVAELRDWKQGETAAQQALTLKNLQATAVLSD